MNPWLKYMQIKKFGSNNQENGDKTQSKSHISEQIGKQAGSDDPSETQNTFAKGNINLINYNKANENDHSSIIIDTENNIKEYNPYKKHFVLSK